MRLHRSVGALRPIVGAAIGLLGALAVAPPPAAADAPRPTDYRSRVISVTPSPSVGVHVEVVGGDAFLALEVPRGHTAVVPDYTIGDQVTDRPYLRFRADGTVQRNRHAVATAANQARYGRTTRPPSPGTEPSWETVAHGGSYAWHDHRIHWMAPSTPRTDRQGRVDLGGPNGTWEVPIVIDGTETVVRGELVLVPAPNGLPWLALIALAGMATVAVGARGGLRMASVVGALASIPAVVAAWATWTAAPPGSGASVVPVAVAAVALVAGVVAAIVRPAARLVAAAACAASLIGWAILRVTVLTRSELPTSLVPWADRSATAVALGVGAGLAIVLVWRPAHRPAPTA